MRISKAALDECEPLFEGFIQEMTVIDRYREDLFQAVHDQSNLFTETLRVLTRYQADRCRGAYCLLINGLVWDAEIIVRTFYEAVAKTLFLATAKLGARQNLLTEFWEVLPAIYDRKMSQKARSAETLFMQADKDSARVFAHLQDPSFYATDPTGNRQSRKEVEQRWSFSKMVEVLNRGDAEHSRIKSIDALFHNYGMSSHLAHASPKAMDLMQDRATRGDDLRILETSHVSRMLGDMIWLDGFSIHFSQTALIGPMKMASALRDSLERMSALTKPFQQEFDRSQDAFYAKVRS